MHEKPARRTPSRRVRANQHSPDVTLPHTDDRHLETASYKIPAQSQPSTPSSSPPTLSWTLNCCTWSSLLPQAATAAPEKPTVAVHRGLWARQHHPYQWTGANRKTTAVATTTRGHSSHLLKHQPSLMPSPSTQRSKHQQGHQQPTCAAVHHTSNPNAPHSAYRNKEATMLS